MFRKLVFLSAALLFSSAAQLGASTILADPTFGPFRFVNTTGRVVYDLETTWSFTGGSLNKGVVTLNDGPGATAIVAAGNKVTITWDDGGLKVGGAVEFKMDGNDGVVFHDAHWSDKEDPPNDVGGANPVPEPATALLLGTALALLRHRRKMAA